MSRDLENWEEIISSKFDGQQIPFNEGDWDRAEELIEKAETRLKRKRWFSIYFLGIVSGALITLLSAKLIFSSAQPSAQLTADSKKQTLVAPAIQNKESTERVVKENNPSDKNSNTNASTENNIAQNQLQNQNEVQAEKINQLTAENNKLKNELVNAEKSNMQAGSKPVLIADNQNQAPVKDFSANNQPQNSNAVPVRNQDAVVINDNAVKPNPEQAAKENELKPGTASSDSLVKSADSLPLVFGKMNPVLDPLLPAKDTVFHPKNVFTVEAGVYYNLGWNYNDTIDGRGINPVAGFAFSHLFNPKWSFSTGIRFESLGHLHYSQKQVTDSTPNFGLNNTSTLIIPQNLFYISIPFKMERVYKSKNIFGMGASVSYLFNTTSQVETIKVTDGYEMLIGDPQTQHGYFGGLNRFDAGLNLSYRRQLFPKWGIMFEASYGLLDIKNNSYFSNPQDKAEHHLGGRFLLTYNLF